MNDDDPLSDVEERLRAWRPAELPVALRARLQATGPAPRRGRMSRHPLLVSACALASGMALLLASRLVRLPDAGNSPTPAAVAGARHTVDADPAAGPHWLLGESLTMNIYTGVPPGNVPAALRLDEDAAAGSGLLPVRSADGKLPLKVDCQF